jgi:3-isopropylmalate/(R)-2-methylmalate dehydratase small subunit
MATSKLTNHTSGKSYDLKPLGDAQPIIEAGGVFNYRASMQTRSPLALRA